MNVNKIKSVIHASPEETHILLDKFLDADLFNARDLYWWWDPNQYWTCNRKYVDKALKILTDEKCLIRIDMRIGQSYKKTPEFVDLLLQMRRIEELLGG